jgi:MtN3 and saliva related transmembrane protein
VPQAYKIFKTRETKDLSLPMWILSVIGFAFWVAYGIATNNWPIIVPNIITFLLSCSILVMKVLS